MLNTFSPASFRSRCDEVVRSDNDLATIIRSHGYPPMWNRPNTFETLVHIILEQQVSLASALAALNNAVVAQTTTLTTIDTFLIMGALVIVLMVVLALLPVRTLPPRIALAKS